MVCKLIVAQALEVVSELGQRVKRRSEHKDDCIGGGADGDGDGDGDGDDDDDKNGDRDGREDDDDDRDGDEDVIDDGDGDDDVNQGERRVMAKTPWQTWSTAWNSSFLKGIVR
eukprot:761113-Hanusia_phi.AAC.3